MSRHKLVPSSYLALIKDGKVLLSKRANTGFFDGYYSMVAGHVEEKETFTQGAIRESLEEAGVKVLSEDLEVIHIMQRKSSQGSERIDVFFTAKKWEGEITNMEPDKCEEIAWFPVDDLPENIIPYIRFAIEKIVKKQFYSEFGFTA